ncbi:MAG: ABC transporter ATP-binding protein [Actinomycetota bacterium]|nr:ABC transporter ATP-binding protein [Actinomycetota bacterium]
MHIRLENLRLSYGGSVAVRDLSLEVAQGEALVLLGQSGCGKTSTMRCVAGLEKPDRGLIQVGDDVLFDSQRGINRPPHRRHIGMVFQSYAVWPHMTVFQNVAFPLTMQRVAKAEVSRRVGETLELVGLDGFATRGASMLSGGQMQRVALARSLVMEPSVMLLDEPLSNLDARLRRRLRGDLRELQMRLGLTSIYVTHDQEEALALADHIAMMQFGRIVQMGRPHEIYAKPRSASIADFLGVENIVPVDRLDASMVQASGAGPRFRVSDVPTGAELRACIRAEDIVLADPSGGQGRSDNRFTATVRQKEFQGATAIYRLRLVDGPEISVLGSKHEVVAADIGADIDVVIPPESIQVLPLEVSDTSDADEAEKTPAERLEKAGA